MNTSISADDFLKSKDFSISKDTKLDKFNTKDLEDFSDVNIKSIKFVESEALDALLEASSISDKTDTPSTPSFQPLNEAGILTSGEALNKSAIGALTNNAAGIQEGAMEFLGKTAKFAEDTNFDLTAESLGRMKEAQETLVKGVKSLANGAEYANSGIRFAGASIQLAGSNISMGSDTAVHTTAPIISTVADVENKQSRSVQETTNQKTTIAKTTFTQIEGLQSVVAGNSMKTVAQSNVVVSNTSSTTAIEKATTNSNNIENMAGNIIKNRSKKGISNEADTIISNQSPNISLVAAESSKSSMTSKETISSDSKNKLTTNKDGSFNVVANDPTGKTVEFKGLLNTSSIKEKWKSIGGLEGQSADKVKPTQAKPGGGNLSILADGSGGTVSIINKNMIMSSTGSLNNTVGGNLNQVAQGSVTMSGAFVNTEADAGLTLSASGYIRQQSGTTGTMISNGFTFAGYRFPALKKFIDKINNIPLQIREIPALSALPLALKIKDLEDCLPAKFKEKDSLEAVLEREQERLNLPDEIAAPTKKEVMQREKPGALSTGKDINDAQGGLIQNSSGINSNKIDGNTMLSKDSSTTEQSPVPKNKLTSAAAVFKGGSDIYPLEDEEAFDLIQRQGKEIIDPDASEETGGPELIKDLIISISDLSIDNTNLALNQKVEVGALLKTDLKAVKHYLYDKLLTDKTLITEEIKYTKEQKEFIDKVIKVKEVLNILNRLEKEITTKSSTGGIMSFVSSAYSTVSNSVSIASNIINELDTSSTFNSIKSASSLAAQITNNDIFTDLNKVISSSQSLSHIYGQVNSVIKDGNVADTFDKLSFEDIETVITNGLNTIGVDNLEKATEIAQILSSIKNSDKYKKEGLTQEVQQDIIRKIATQAGFNYEQAEIIYGQAKEVIAQVLSGNIKNIVKGSELQNVLGYFIGASNAALLNNIRDIYLKGVSSVAQGKELFNKGESLYQDGKELYATLQSVPALVGLMNQYEVPLLNQVKTVFQCLELITKIQTIIENIKIGTKAFSTLGNTIEGTLNAFEDLITTEKSTSLEKISGGLIKGELPKTNVIENISDTSVTSFNNTNTTISVNTNTNTNINTVNNFEEVEVITQTQNIQVELNNQKLNKENCSTVIFSYGANTNDSEDPSQWTENISEIDVIDLIEKLPRLTQIYNSIKEIPSTTSITLLNELNSAQIESIKTTEIQVPINNCYIAPKLNLVEASVSILEIKENILLYKLKYINSLELNNKNIFPSNNTIVQIYVENFFNNKTKETMNIIKSREFFSPSIYNFKTTIFDKEKNLGIAYLMNNQNRIHLLSNSGITYNYSITDIGNKLNPIIKDAYIVA